MMATEQITRWHLYSAGPELVDRAVAAILRAADQAIAARDEFSIVLAGGTTPQLIYARLAEAPANWARWVVYFGDERCLPVDHPERNSLMASSAWLDRARKQGLRVIPIQAELGAEEGAVRYGAILQELDTFDLVLLGLGEDGHTASLFPGHEWGGGDQAPSVLPVHSAPKPPSDRISLSAARLSEARQVLVFVTGTGKSEAVRGWRSGKNLPIAAIRPVAGVDALITADAWNGS